MNPVLMSKILRSRFSRYRRRIALSVILAAAIGLALAPAGAIRAASPTPARSAPPAQANASVQAHATTVPNARPSEARAPAAAAAKTAAPADAHAIISYLSDVISWSRHLSVEAQLVRQPEEALFFADDAQSANEIVKLAFIYARAQTAYNEKTHAGPGDSAQVAPPAAQDLAQKFAQANADLAAARKRLKDLQDRLARSPARGRAQIESQAAVMQSEVELAQARADALAAMVEFSAGSSKSTATVTGLAAQIDELERAVPQAESNSKPVAPKVSPPAEPGGIIGLTSSVLDLGRESETLEQTAGLTRQLLRRVAAMRAPLIGILERVDQRGIDLSHQASSGNLTDFRQRRKDYEDLIDAHKLASATLLPLSKQEILLGLYAGNLMRWRASVDHRQAQELRSLIVRLVGLLSLLGMIAAGAYLWRYFTVRFVADPRRRHQLLAARRLAMWVGIVFVVLLNFANQMGAFATIMGFAAAGIAVALQNVILSVAGYFFLIGRFGIRAGDRVQIGTVTGDVISIGLVKLTLVELAGTDLQPTGRVVVYSNAVVFQPNGNFYKQAPGMSFVWNEVRLTLAPDCDYRLAEKRLLDAVEDVFSRYRDKVQGDFRHLESDLHMMLDNPRPTSRMMLTSAGLEMIIRYPAGVRTSHQVADEVTRRLLDVIDREPALKLVAPGTPNIQPIQISAHEEAALPGSADAGDGVDKSIAAAAERKDDKNADDAPAPPAAKS
ncbi:MAG TPA: mechanosensitive ion channel family protein [Candidatus Binataceae bacterium]|nr:mechanosensitive ion channel family protein [Candidatus Binataceae bacterium]